MLTLVDFEILSDILHSNKISLKLYFTGPINDYFCKMFIIETISPSEYSKSRSKYTILYDFQDTKFGTCLIGVVKNSAKSICHLAFIDNDKECGLKRFKETWHLSHLVQESTETKSKISAIFAKKYENLSSDITVLLKGTDFQIAVWKALTTIHSGSCVTYADVAKMIDKPQAVRAVANAVAANRVGYLIPCHRVVGKNGSNKFSWGTDIKEKMQTFEKDTKTHKDAEL